MFFFSLSFEKRHIPTCVCIHYHFLWQILLTFCRVGERVGKSSVIYFVHLMFIISISRVTFRLLTLNLDTELCHKRDTSQNCFNISMEYIFMKWRFFCCLVYIFETGNMLKLQNTNQRATDYRFLIYNSSPSNQLSHVPTQRSLANVHSTKSPMLSIKIKFHLRIFKIHLWPFWWTSPRYVDQPFSYRYCIVS